jgi:hypothetical protein
MRYVSLVSVLIKAKLYLSSHRFWLDALKSQLALTRRRQKESFEAYTPIFRLMKQAVVPDSLLMELANVKESNFPLLYKAIRMDMIQRHEKQAHFFVKSWLGIQEFCQNPMDLQVGKIKPSKILHNFYS